MDVLEVAGAELLLPTIFDSVRRNCSSSKSGRRAKKYASGTPSVPAVPSAFTASQDATSAGSATSVKVPALLPVVILVLDAKLPYLAAYQSGSLTTASSAPFI